MPLQNRVAPDAQLLAAPARGLFLGNRGGRLHDPLARTLTPRRWISRRWICCALSFRGRQRAVWSHGYTELFFLDEVTALAAGHRPCMECRRADALAFRRAVADGRGLSGLPSCDNLDRLLHAERLDGRAKRFHRLPADDLPDGAIVRLADESAAEARFAALRGAFALFWSPSGYVGRKARPTGLVDVATPPIAIAALRQGYRPVWHCSANGR